MPAAPLVIVGASLAGLRAAQAIRAAGEEGEVVVIGEEAHLPYTRPPLSKGVLEGAETPESTDLGAAACEVTWRLGERAAALDRDAREVVLEDGGRQPYRRLVVATGATPRAWSGPGAGLDGLVTLRTLDDALDLRARLLAGPRVVTVGAGFIGCEVAATARALGLEVTMVDVAEHPMPGLGPELGAWAADLHRSRGVGLRLGTGVEAIEGEGRVEAVRLADGTRLPCDLAVIALGAVPQTRWLEGSGLTLLPALRVDATLTSTDDPDVLAAGDVCAWPHPHDPQAALRVEHWSNAVEQGRLAGRNALLEPSERAPFTGVPSMWSDQHGLRIQSAGLMAAAERVHVLEAEPGGERLVAAGEGPDGRIVAAVAVAAPRRLLWYRKQIEAGAALEEVAAAVREDDGALGPPLEPAA